MGVAKKPRHHGRPEQLLERRRKAGGDGRVGVLRPSRAVVAGCVVGEDDGTPAFGLGCGQLRGQPLKLGGVPTIRVVNGGGALAAALCIRHCDGSVVAQPSPDGSGISRADVRPERAPDEAKLRSGQVHDILVEQVHRRLAFELRCELRAHGAHGRAQLTVLIEVEFVVAQKNKDRFIGRRLAAQKFGVGTIGYLLAIEYVTQESKVRRARWEHVGLAEHRGHCLLVVCMEVLSVDVDEVLAQVARRHGHLEVHVGAELDCERR
mmetsp:Transcript_35647/g.107559  ORF Transcript_35647/g.107559 Transcript_35647/m.107559 type:complete len:264 (+) Transcript_35647:308-1099(+)